jgi:uncharacterized damage-inducible protein DinB
MQVILTNAGETTMELYGPKELASSVRTVRKNTIQIAEDIPEGQYTYRPTPDSRSVAETLVHIASASWADFFLHGDGRPPSLENFDFATLIRKGEEEEKVPRSKSQILDMLSTQGERWCQWVEELSHAHLAEQIRLPGGISKTRFEMLLGTKEHEMHHRGQLTVIERLLGIIPHLTRKRRRSPEKAAS